MGMASFVLALCGLAIAAPGAFGDKPRPPPRFAVDLDKPPEHRWDHILSLPQYKNSLPKWIKILKENFGPSLPLAEAVGSRLDVLAPAPYAQEMRGIARVVGAKVGDVFIMNIFYELTAYCTSVVARGPGGAIFHGRNLDYDYADVFRNYTMRVDFRRGNKTAYTASTFAGLIGVFTGQSPYSFTISLDERDQGALWENALMLLLGRTSRVASWMIRDLLDRNASFAGAVREIAGARTIASAYYILGGVRPAEGVVITHDHFGAADLWYLDTQPAAWFRVETNYDHWDPPPASDDRRKPANDAMKRLGQRNLNAKGLFSVLSVKPVHNNQTVYTTVMSAQQPDLYTSKIRYFP